MILYPNMKNQMRSNLFGTLDAVTFVQVALLLRQLLQLQKAKARDGHCHLSDVCEKLSYSILKRPVDIPSQNMLEIVRIYLKIEENCESESVKYYHYSRMHFFRIAELPS